VIEDARGAAARHLLRRVDVQTDRMMSAMSRIWRAFALAACGRDCLEVSFDPQFIDKVRDILAVPAFRAAVVVCRQKS
jgi:hypothetical protein